MIINLLINLLLLIDYFLIKKYRTLWAEHVHNLVLYADVS